MISFEVKKMYCIFGSFLVETCYSFDNFMSSSSFPTHIFLLVYVNIHISTNAAHWKKLHINIGTTNKQNKNKKIPISSMPPP